MRYRSLGLLAAGAAGLCLFATTHWAFVPRTPGEPGGRPDELAAAQAKSGAVLGSSVVALVAVLAAFGAGSAFTQNGDNGASFGMALTAAVAMLCYAANLVILGRQRG